MKFLALLLVFVFFSMPLKSWAKMDQDMLNLEDFLAEEKQNNEIVPEKIKPLVEEVVQPKVVEAIIPSDTLEKQGSVQDLVKKVIAPQKNVGSKAPDEMTLRFIAGAAGLFAILIILLFSRKKVKAQSSEVIKQQSDEEGLEIDPGAKNKKIMVVTKKEEVKKAAPVKVNLPGKMDAGSSKIKVNLPSKSTQNVEVPTESEPVKPGMIIAKRNKVNRPPNTAERATD